MTMLFIHNFPFFLQTDMTNRMSKMENLIKQQLHKTQNTCSYTCTSLHTIQSVIYTYTNKKDVTHIYSALSWTRPIKLQMLLFTMHCSSRRNLAGRLTGILHRRGTDLFKCERVPEQKSQLDPQRADAVRRICVGFCFKFVEFQVQIYC